MTIAKECHRPNTPTRHCMSRKSDCVPPSHDKARQHSRCARCRHKSWNKTRNSRIGFCKTVYGYKFPAFLLCMVSNAKIAVYMRNPYKTPICKPLFFHENDVCQKNCCHFQLKTCVFQIFFANCIRNTKRSISIGNSNYQP